MAVLPETPVQQNEAFLAGARETPAGGAAPAIGAGPAGPSGETAPAAQVDTQPQPQPGAVPTPTQTPPMALGEGSDLTERLTGPIFSQVEETGAGLRDVEADFRRLAGPERTYDAIGAEETLRGAVYDPSEANARQARELLQAQYTGPQRLDTAPLESDLEEARARASGLSGRSLISSVQQSEPGLTSGEARFDARALTQDPRFTGQRQAARSAVDELYEQLAEADRQAEEYAAERLAQERDIAIRARGYLTGERRGISEDLEEQVAAAEAQNRAVEQAYEQFRESPSLAALQNMSPEFLDFDPAALHTEAQKAAREAAEEWSRALQSPEYADIRDVPLGHLRISSHGHEQFSLDPTGRTNVGEYDRQTYEKARRRFEALEQQFGPGSYAKRRRQVEGEHAPFLPMYHGQGVEPFQALPRADYVSLVPGLSPARENVATEDQRAAFNRINDLLGEAERLAEAEPFRAAAIAADVDRYLADEERALEERRGKISKNRAEWERLVRKARRRYKKSKKGGLFGAVGGIVGAVLSGGNPLGGLIGSQAGRVL